MAAYEEDELVSDLDNEKRIYRAEREVERVAKRKQPGGSNAAWKKAAAGDTAPMQPAARRQNSQGSRPPVARPRLVGLCYRCAEWGHLVANCPKLVSKAGESLNNNHSVCADDSSTSHVVCVNTTHHEYSLKTRGASLSHEGVHNKKG